MMRNIVIKSKSDSIVTVSGYASVFNVIDKQQDIMKPGAFMVNPYNDSLKQVRLLWQHDKSKPIGIIRVMREDDYGLFVEAEININTVCGKDAYLLIEQGAIDSFSIGFEVLDFEMIKKTRILKLVRLLEVSLVTFPANPYAVISKLVCNSGADKNQSFNNASINSQYIDISTKIDACASILDNNALGINP